MSASNHLPSQSGSDRAHWQGLRALRGSSGWAVAVDQATYLAEQARIASEVGLVVETSAAVAVSAARSVSSHVDGLTVALSLSGGFKDPVVTYHASQPLEVLPANLDRLAEYVSRRRPDGAPLIITTLFVDQMQPHRRPQRYLGHPPS